MLVLGMLVTPFAFADDVADAVANHQKMAAEYQAKAAEQDALIAEHSTMDKKYEERFWMIKKAGKPNNVLEMDKHCTAIVQNATALRNEMLEFAKWHQMRAAELQGQ
jgi:hypothetical protein